MGKYVVYNNKLVQVIAPIRPTYVSQSGLQYFYVLDIMHLVYLHTYLLQSTNVSGFFLGE